MTPWETIEWVVEGMGTEYTITTPSVMSCSPQHKCCSRSQERGTFPHPMSSCPIGSEVSQLPWMSLWFPPAPAGYCDRCSHHAWTCSASEGGEEESHPCQNTCREVGVIFIPLVVEALGGWSEEAITTIKTIGRLQGQCLSIPPPESTHHLFQRLAISLWRGMWLKRKPTCPARVDRLI